MNNDTPGKAGVGTSDAITNTRNRRNPVKFNTFASIAIGAIAMAAAGQAQARDQIQIVGSSTVFPFSIAVAEAFGQKTEFKTPVVESTGSGGGIKLFCAGVGENTPDIANASRRIKESEVKQCNDNSVTPVEVKIGFDGIVLAHAKDAADIDLTLEQLYQALAKSVEKDGQIVANPNMNWSDIDASLPNARIEVLGPPPTSGTRDAFVELVMEKGCPKMIEEKDAKLCTEMREDGAFIEAGENDNLMVQKIDQNKDAFAIFGFSYLDQNADKLKGASINGVAPEFENIASGEYAVSRPLFFYVKKEHVGVIPGIEGYIAEFTDDGTWGNDGYLVDKGLIPLPDADRASSAEDAKMLKPVSM